MIGDPDFQAVIDDEASFLDRSGTVFVMTDPEIVFVAEGR
jgi:hypothetical protein